MRHWSGMLFAIGMTSFANTANAQDCEAIQAGPARTDCYIGLSASHKENPMLPLVVRASNQMPRATSR